MSDLLNEKRARLRSVSTPDVVVAHLPHELRAYRRFMVWAYELSFNEHGEPVLKKIPRKTANPLSFARTNDEADLVSFAEAIACWRANPGIIDGIGFAPSEADPYVFVDIDDPVRLEPEHIE